MSRTVRRKRKATGKVRDGVFKYGAASCRHNGGCPYCEGNRTHGSRRREPIAGDYSAHEDE